MKLPMVPGDKANHAIYGFAAYVGTFALTGHWQLGLAVCLLGGIAKELYDRKHNGVSSEADVVATFLGGLAGLGAQALAIFR